MSDADLRSLLFPPPPEKRAAMFSAAVVFLVGILVLVAPFITKQCPPQVSAAGFFISCGALAALFVLHLPSKGPVHKDAHEGEIDEPGPEPKFHDFSIPPENHMLLGSSISFLMVGISIIIVSLCQTGPLSAQILRSLPLFGYPLAFASAYGLLSPPLFYKPTRSPLKSLKTLRGALLGLFSLGVFLTVLPLTLHPEQPIPTIHVSAIILVGFIHVVGGVFSLFLSFLPPVGATHEE